MDRGVMTADQPLWRENEHGDIWQEPTLFDQPANDRKTQEQQRAKGETDE